MVKFLHFADVHLGMENYGKIDKKTGLHSRMSDFCRSFDAIVDYAIKNKVDFALFAGDAYKTRDPSPTYQREFSKRIKKIADAGIQVVLLVGNHDMPNASGRANTLDIYSALDVKNVYVSREPEILEFVKINNHWIIKNGDLNYDSGIHFQIATLPWILKTKLLPPEEYEKKEISESYSLMTKKMAEIIENLSNNINKKFPCVFLGHATLAGAEFGAERKAYIGHDIVVPSNILQKGPWQYVALGHLHKYQIILKNPPIIYSGSIERVDFGEEKEDKGFIDCEINKSRSGFDVNYKFIALPVRKFLTIFCELKENDLDITKKVIEQIRKNDTKDSVVKIKLKIPESSLPNLQEREIQQALSDVYYFAGIQKEIIKSERKQKLENIESLTILEILEKYWQSKNIGKKRIEELKIYTQKLLE